jgi:hypothetical protein
MTAWVRQPQWRRRFSALIAVAAAVAYVGIGPAPVASADGVDQIVGSGDTPSALTVSWSQGLLGLDNHTIVGKRDPASPNAFMYPDFQNLTVHIAQTQQIVHQSVLVTWSGGLPTEQPFKTNFLQFMQCYGDTFTGPDPEACEYGSAGMMGNGLNTSIGTREGRVCTGPPDLVNPPGATNGSGAVVGCDPAEPTNDDHKTAPCKPGVFCDVGYSVPFIPVGKTDKAHGQTEINEFFDQFSSNEVQQASTGADGKGQLSFQTMTGIEAPSLGCGLTAPDGKVRDCWLVIVPRGTYDPNGWKANGTGNLPGTVNESPLGAASWAQRIQIHLNFAQVPSSCPIGSAKERPLVGSELAARAVFSWQLALNAAAHCVTIFGYAPTPESTSTTQLASSTGAGLAFTTIPIGSEVLRSGGTPGPAPPVVYAPVTISAIAFGFYISQVTGVVTNHIKLTPRLLAKALTQSYRFDLPDVDGKLEHPGPDWAKHNPDFLTTDPEFVKLNPGINTPPATQPLAPLVTEDHSSLNMQVWSWIVTDPAARAWLHGEPDENGMVINPNYNSDIVQLADKAADSFPRADPTCFNTHDGAERDPGRCTLDLLPYMRSFDDTATRIRAANNPLGAAWDPQALAPDGQSGWWSKGGTEPAGRIFLWGMMSSAEVAGLGLVPADLCKADGTGCVDPNQATVAAALSTATPDSAGLLHVNPAAAGGLGYPLVTVTYAAVRTDQGVDALRNYASLIQFAAGAGQVPGVEPGQLPRGYLPLPDDLRREDGAAAATLTTLAEFQVHPPPPTPAPVPTTTTIRQAPPVPSPLPVGGYTTAKAVSAPETFTPTTPLGTVRWALLGIVILGLLGAVGGPVIRGIGRYVVVRRWRR